MTDIKVIGAGMWRTGTVSLKAALEQLMDQPCHHMTELISHPGTAVDWLTIVQGRPANWDRLLNGYAATLDWPSMAFWRELSEYYPKAKVLLSVRDPEDWWNSISQTVLVSAPTLQTAKSPWELLVANLFEKKFIGRHPTKDQAIQAYLKHNDEVRETISSDRLIEWSINDGWQPLCQALGYPVPKNDFPHLNTAEDYRKNNRLPSV